jgi:hypothetical protein
MTLVAHALYVVQVRLKSVGNEEHFTQEAEKFFRLYLPLHLSGATVIYHMAVPAHEFRTVHFILKSISSEGHFILEDERVFRRLSPCIAMGD